MAETPSPKDRNAEISSRITELTRPIAPCTSFVLIGNPRFNAPLMDSNASRRWVFASATAPIPSDKPHNAFFCAMSS